MSLVSPHSPPQRLAIIAYILAKKFTPRATKRCRKRVGRALDALQSPPDAARVAPGDIAMAEDWILGVCRRCGGCEMGRR